MKNLILLFFYCCLYVSSFGYQSTFKNGLEIPVLSNCESCDIIIAETTPQLNPNIPAKEHDYHFGGFYFKLSKSFSHNNHFPLESFCIEDIALVSFRAFLKRKKQYYNTVHYCTEAASFIRIRSE